METLFVTSLLLLAAFIWIWTGRTDPETELRELGGDSDRLIEAQIRREPGISRGEAARRVLAELRKGTDGRFF